MVSRPEYVLTPTLLPAVTMFHGVSNLALRPCARVFARAQNSGWNYTDACTSRSASMELVTLEIHLYAKPHEARPRLRQSTTSTRYCRGTDCCLERVSLAETNAH